MIYDRSFTDAINNIDPILLQFCCWPFLVQQNFNWKMFSYIINLYYEIMNAWSIDSQTVFKKWTYTQCSNSLDMYRVLPFILICNELIKVLIQIIFHFRRVSNISTLTQLNKSFILVHLSLSIYLHDTLDILIFHWWVNICCQNSHFK